MTPALKLLALVWQSGKKDSWERINHAMRNALALAIGSGLQFKATDFDHMASKFRWSYWVSESAEWIYTDAIINGNVSCIEAFEKWKGREPFRANKVTTGYYHTPYLHRSSINRLRERVGVGMGFPMAKKQWYVTGFDDEAGTIRLATYKGHRREGAPVKLLKLSLEAFQAEHPAPKKPKKPATPSDSPAQG